MGTISVFFLYCIFLVRLQIMVAATVLCLCLLLCNFAFLKKNAGLWEKSYVLSHISMLLCLSFGFLRISKADKECSVETTFGHIATAPQMPLSMWRFQGLSCWWLVFGLESHHPFKKKKLLPKRCRALNVIPLLLFKNSVDVSNFQQGLANFPCKVPDSKYLGVHEPYSLSPTTQLCCCSVKAAIDRYVNKRVRL